MNLDKVKNDAEELIRTGRRAEARDLLLTLKGKKLPRPRISDFGTLARRCGLAAFGLQLMSSIIRPKTPLDEPATSEEKATYALLLLGIGANSESLELLKSADQNNLEVRLATAFSYINSWDYEAAIPHLISYIGSSTVPYQQMIAKVNLAASYVAIEQTKPGFKLLEEILVTTAKQNWNLLHKNALELSAQVAIQENDWSRADQLLSDAASDSDELALDRLFIKKWKAIAALERNSKSTEAMSQLSAVRETAIQSNHWETVRDCDFRMAVHNRDKNLLSYVYFGSPHARFRERLEREVKDWFEFPKDYIWQTSSSVSDRVFDLQNAEEENSKNDTDLQVDLKPGKGLHVALQVLSSDFYRPFLIGSLHNGVFPGEHFNSLSSPRRISFLIHRLREWFKENDIPLTITVSNSGYQLQASGPYAFRLYKDYQSGDEDSPLHYLRMLEKLREHWGAKNFSATEISEHLEVSVRTARYLATWGLENEKLKKTGSGRTTRYSFT